MKPDDVWWHYTVMAEHFTWYDRAMGSDSLRLYSHDVSQKSIFFLLRIPPLYMKRLQHDGVKPRAPIWQNRQDKHDNSNTLQITRSYGSFQGQLDSARYSR